VFYVPANTVYVIWETGRRKKGRERGMWRRHRTIFKAGNPSLKYEYGPVPSPHYSLPLLRPEGEGLRVQLPPLKL